MKYFLKYITSFFLLTSLVSCNKNVSTNVSLEEVESTFAELLNEAINTSFETIPGLSMTVNAPELGINWTSESGFDSKKEENELEADQPFRIASVTKTFVATAILRMHEKGIISITDPISKYISSEHNLLLEKGGYAPSALITIYSIEGELISSEKVTSTLDQHTIVKEIGQGLESGLYIINVTSETVNLSKKLIIQK